MSAPVVVVVTSCEEATVAYAEALRDAGFDVSFVRGAAWTFEVIGDDRAVMVHGHGAVLRLAPSVAPADLATVVHLLWQTERLLDASLIAHDANNMMFPIMLAAHELVDLERTRSFVAITDEIVRGCERLALLLQRLLDARKLGGERLVDVGKVIATLEPRIVVLASERRLKTRSVSRPLRVWMDPLNLERVILNLVANARDATSPGGHVTITCERDGEWVVISVTDDGHGMDDVTLTRARACKPFFTTKRQGKGTGLGLAGSARSIAAAGGRLDIDSAIGVGTTVRVWLPAASSL